MSDSPRQYFGTPIEQYPEPCQSCVRLAAVVIALDNPDLTKLRPYPFPETRGHRIARAIFPRLDICSPDACGVKNLTINLFE